MKGLITSVVAVSSVCFTAPVLAQDTGRSAGSAPTIEYELTDSRTFNMPILEFVSTPEIEADFDKYFYFHREQTSFAEAWADIGECDALASGSNIYRRADSAAMASAMTQYGALAGGVGGVIGSAIADAIVGSAARREQRRLNLRACMGFKEYRRFGLSRDRWTEFNFEEGLGRKKENERINALQLQALVASGPKPMARELGN